MIYPSNILKCLPKSERSKLGKSGVTREEAQEVFNIRKESDLHKLITNELTRREIRFITSRFGRKTRMTKSAPDFIFPLPPHGKFAFIEAKAAGGKASEEQIKFIDQLRSNGAIGIVTDDFNTVKRFLETADNAELSEPAHRI